MRSATAYESAVLAVALALLGVGAIWSAQAPTAAEIAPGTDAPPRVLLNRDGSELGLTTDQIIQILGNGRVVSRKPIGVGVTGAERMEIELNGVTLRAAFHDVHETRLGPTRQGPKKRVLFFLDSYRAQVSAYEVALLLGLETVPPTVSRRIGRSEGSLQLWVEGCITRGMELDAETRVPDRTYRQRQMADIRVFDNLIGNTDRNEGNILVDKAWNLWWIDHTRSFARDAQLFEPEHVKRASRPMWDAIRALEKGEATRVLSPYLSQAEIDALFVRRDRVVEILGEQIAERGAEAVLFDYDDPPEVVRISFEEATDQR